jgi:hypothetical protein
VDLGDAPAPFGEEERPGRGFRVRYFPSRNSCTPSGLSPAAPHWREMSKKARPGGLARLRGA